MSDFVTVSMSHKGRHTEFTLFSFQTGAQLYAEAQEALGFPLKHSLRLHDGDTGESIDVTNDDTVFQLPDRPFLHAETMLIVWILTEPDVPCTVLHKWRDEMPGLLADTSQFPDGHAYGRRGNIINGDSEWAGDIQQLFVHRPDGTIPDREWRAPCVCSCDLRNAKPECPVAWLL